MVIRVRRLSEIFELSDEVTIEWRKLYNGEVKKIHTLRNITGEIESGSNGCGGHAERMGTRKHVYKIILENLKRRDLLYNTPSRLPNTRKNFLFTVIYR